MTHVTTFGRSLGIMSTARPELPYPCISKTKSRVKNSQRGKLCDYKVSRVLNVYVTYKMYYMYFAASKLTICDRSKGSIYMYK